MFKPMFYIQLEYLVSSLGISGSISWEAWGNIIWRLVEKKISAGAHDQIKRGLNSLSTLGAWTLWNHRNRCVFDGASPSLARTFHLTSEELYSWCCLGCEASTTSWQLCQARFKFRLWSVITFSLVQGAHVLYYLNGVGVYAFCKGSYPFSFS
jgi:hypothetical protein